MSNAPSFDRHSGGEVTERSRDARIAALAGRQHGVVAGRQLRAVGVGPDAITYRRRSGRLHELHRGVYAVGHTVLSIRGRWMAAVLAAGPDAVLSHRAAAGLWGVRRSTALEITASRRIRHDGIVPHRATLPSDEITTRAGIPVTTITRTIFDLAAVARFHDVEAAVNEAQYRELKDSLSLAALAARYPGRRAQQTIRRLITEA